MKKLIFSCHLEVTDGSGFISQRYGSADPDPNQTVTDLQHW